jgi:hypothetical protein
VNPTTQPKVIAKIEILLTSEGQVVTNWNQSLSLPQYNLMIAGSLDTVTKAMAKKAQAQAVEVAPPDFQAALNGR